MQKEELILAADQAAREASNQQLYIYLSQLKKIDESYDINSLHAGLSLLNIAAATDNCELINWLLANGANINQRMESYFHGNMTSLLMALADHKFAAALLLIEQGADIHLVTRKASALNLAIKASNAEIVASLLSKDVNLAYIDHKRFSAFHVAADEGNIEIIQLLLLANKDLKLLKERDHFGRNIIDIAVSNGLTSLVHQLLDRQDKLDIVKIFLKNGANLADAQKQTLFEFAAMTGDKFLATYAVCSSPAILDAASNMNKIEIRLCKAELLACKDEFIVPFYERMLQIEDSNPELKGFYGDLVTKLFLQDLPKVTNITECKDYALAILDQVEELLAYQYKPSFLAGVSKDFKQMFSQKLSAEAYNDNEVDSASQRARIEGGAKLDILPGELTKHIGSFIGIEASEISKDKFVTKITKERIKKTDEEKGLAR